MRTRHSPVSLAFGLTLLTACAGGAAVPPSPATPTTAATPLAASPTSLLTTAAASPTTSTNSAPVQGAATTVPSAAGGPIDPCSLITKDEAQAALGLKFDRGTVARGGSAVGGHGSDCNYETANPADPSFTLHVLTADEFSADRSISIPQWVDVAKKNTQSNQPVNGVGDAAFWDPSLQTLDVVKGNTFLSLFTTDIKGKYKLNLDAAKALAQKAVGRL